jgi:Cu/Ag efflux pump CusA
VLGGLISSTLLNLFVLPALTYRYVKPQSHEMPAELSPTH